MASGSVQVNRDAVRRTWRASDGYEFWLEFRTDSPAESAFCDVIDEVSTAGDGDGVYCQLGGPTLAGYVTLVEQVEDAEHLDTWLTDLAARLQQAGFTGTLTGLNSKNRPTWSLGNATEPSGFAMWSIGDDVMARNPGTTGSWGIPDDTRRRIFAAAAEWAKQGGPSILMRHATFTLGLSDAATVVTALERIIPSGLTGAAYFYNDSARRARNISFANAGESMFQIVDDAATWQQRTDQLLEAITVYPGLLDLAFIRPAARVALSWHDVDVFQKFDEISQAKVLYNRHLLTGWTPDAHGIQVLTDDHLAKAHDLSEWTVSDLGGGRHLVTANDLEPWYAPKLPEPEVVERARRDFGDMLLTKQVIADHPPPWRSLT